MVCMIMIVYVYGCEEGSLAIDGVCTSIYYIPGCVKYDSANRC